MKKIAPIAVIVAIVGGIGVMTMKKSPTQAVQDNHAHDNTSNNHANHDHTPNAKNNQSLTVVSPWEITSIDPSKSGFLFQRLGIAETLVDTDQDGKLTAGLATDWHTSDNGKTWQFHLRENVKFHDGTPLTADEVVQSLSVALTKPTALESAQIDSIKAINPTTVEFVLKEPSNIFAAYLAHATSIILAKASFDAAGEVVKLIGTGAYQVSLVEPPQKLEQIAFADYWGEKARIQNISYLANSRSEARTLLAQSNPNYLVYTLDSASLKRLQDDPNMQVLSESLTRTIQYKVNAQAPMFKDTKVRQLLSQAIDRQGIAESILNINNGMAEQILPPIFKDWQITTSHQTPNYATIKDGFLQLGYTQDAKGMLSKDGKPFAFTLKTFSDRPELPLVATALQNQWRQVGVDVKVVVGNFADIPASHQDGTLQMALYARNYGSIPDPIGTLAEDFSPKGSDWGAMNWQNASLNQSLSTLATLAPNDPNGKALKQKISQIIYDERPVTPILYYQQNVAASTSLKGLQIDPLERSFYLNKLYFE